MDLCTAFDGFEIVKDADPVVGQRLRGPGKCCRSLSRACPEMDRCLEFVATSIARPDVPNVAVAHMLRPCRGYKPTATLSARWRLVKAATCVEVGIAHKSSSLFRPLLVRGVREHTMKMPQMRDRHNTRE